MTTVRRSTRIKTASSKASSQLISEDAETVDQRYKDLLDADEHNKIGSAFESDESSEEDNDDDADEDYVVKPKKSSSSVRQPRKRKSAAKNTTTIKRAKTIKQSVSNEERRKYEEHYQNLINSFHPTTLFTSMCTSENTLALSELVHNWLDVYAESPNKAKQQFVNFVLNCSGSLIQVEEHDVANSDSANETVSEVQLLFHEQKFHEFYLLNSCLHKNQHKEYKYLYENFVEFMDHLIKISYEKGFLCVAVEEETAKENQNNDTDTSQPQVTIGMGPMILDLIIWLSSLSVSNFRCFRYTASLALYVFETALVQLIPTIETDSIQNLKQLHDRESKKKRPNKVAMEQWKSQLQEEQEHKTTIEKIISEIFKVSFVHRFRDIDEHVRSNSIYYLSQWFKAWPEHFYQVTYLKYFGWLLNDENVQVRNQVLSSLAELVKFSNSRNSLSIENDCFRQFFERFQDKIKQITCIDSSYDCRMHAIKVLTQINHMDYLEESDRLAMSSLLFKIDSTDEKFSTSTSKESRFYSAVAKMFYDSECFTELQIPLKKTKTKSKTKNNVGKAHDFLQGIKFIKYLLESLSCHISISKKIFTYDNFSLTDVDIEFNSFAEYSQKLYQACQFLSLHYKHLIPILCQMLTYTGNFEDLYDIDTDEFDETLMPNNKVSRELYIIVLSGLCMGNSRAAVSNTELKNTLADEIPVLMKELDYRSSPIDVIYTFKILTLFNFESFSESSLSEITQHIKALFMSISLKDAHMKKAFQDVFQFYKNKIGSSVYDQIWVSTISEMLEKTKQFLKTNFDKKEITFNDNCKQLFEVYIDKLVALGKFYKLPFDEDFVSLFISKFFESLVDEVDDLDCGLLNFKIFPLLTSWSLLDLENKELDYTQTMTDQGENGVLAVPAFSSDFFNSIYNFVQYLIKTEERLFALVGDESLNTLLLKLSSTVMDLLISLKAFSLNCDIDEWVEAIESDYNFTLHETDYAKVLYSVFCFVESKAAGQLGIENLERLSNEDTSYDQYLEQTGKHSKQGGAFSDGAIDTTESITFSELCVFTIKLKTLQKLSILNVDDAKTKKLLARMSLNKSAFGSVFSNIVDDNASNQRPTVISTAPAKPIFSKNEISEVAISEELDHDEFAEDPIEDSESSGF
ncbi:hypothetical protein ACO0QE_001566 [Hanseniaspora vineae]